ncbi:MAG: adenylyl-sulfate kinase [Mesorhizobium amorphae]|nr:MAG: adenylyl-sulfate kinase [Mesorhizobium amorphae]
MAHKGSLIATDIDGYLDQHEAKGLLRFITCGSVDDGKSTLIGRLLYDSKMIFEDHLASLEADSRKMGTQKDAIDFALLVDGLAAEREQGITIDVAYRYFSTDKRKFIVADTPGHEQYTRNMVTGASTADLAVILIDARRGVLTQTRRHAYLVSLLGIRDVVLAVNKMDLVGHSQEVFDAIVAEFARFAASLPETRTVAIPMSALMGDNITQARGAMPWYRGPTLMGHLESVPLARDAADAPFRMPVQWVNRPDMDFRGFSGLIAGGRVAPGDAVTIMPAGTRAEVASVRSDAELPHASAGQSVTIVLDREVDCSRGDVISSLSEAAGSSDQFRATLVWMSEKSMLSGRSYLLKIGARTVSASVTALKHKVNVNTFEKTAARELTLNEIGVCNIGLDQPVAFDPYDVNRTTGGFILIDRLTNDTLAAGLIQFALRRADNIPRQSVDIDRRARAEQKHQQPCVLWFTGLSGAGKSTIANLVERRLFAMGRHSALLDGDNLRHGLCRDLGFTDADRVENIRRVGEVARLMAEAGLIVLVSLISPFRSERSAARQLMGQGAFLEIHVDTPLPVAEARDPKGLYRKARAGEIENFTGISSAYEPPEQPELRIDTTTTDPETAADGIVAEMERRGLLRGSAS